MPINSITGNTLLTSGSFPPVRAASTGSPLNPATGGLLVVDGVQLVAGDRVLCKDETNPVNNGIYAAQTGPWVRTTDATTNQQFFSGMAVTVGLGAVNAGLTFICTTADDPVVVGTSNITFQAQSAVQTATQTATSTASLTIGAGSRTLTIQSGKAFQVNQEVLVYETSNTANSMLGQVTAYSGPSLTVNVTNTAGSGTHSDWTVVLYGSVAAAGITPPVGSGNVTGPGSSAAGHIATFADATGKLLADGGAPIGAPNTIMPSMLASAAIAFGVGMLNGTLVATVAGNALTIAVKTLAGNDPSSSDPVFFLHTNASSGSGAYVVTEVTSALSIAVPSGATLGTVNGQASRTWIGGFRNGNNIILAVYNSLNSIAGAQSILPWDETSTANLTGVTSSSTSSQIWYGSSTLSSTYFRILGYAESTQSIAGQWALTPVVKLFGPGVKKPGDVVQTLSTSMTSGTNNSSTSFVATNLSQTITLVFPGNLVRYSMQGAVTANSIGTSNVGPVTQMFRSLAPFALTMALGTSQSSTSQQASGTGQMGVGAVGYDIPASSSQQAYGVGMRSTQGGANQTFGDGTLVIDEIQI